MEPSSPGDLYVDKDGKFWRVVSYCAEPTVTMEELEPQEPVNPYALGQASSMRGMPERIPLIRHKISGGVSGLMWNGFKRIYSPEKR